MNVKEIAEQLNLKVVSGHTGLSNEISGGYTSDLMSDVIAHADHGNIWITLQTHKNVMAIASLKDLSAVIIVNNQQPEDDMISQSNEEGIPVLVTNDPTFVITGMIFNLINNS